MCTPIFHNESTVSNLNQTRIKRTTWKVSLKLSLLLISEKYFLNLAYFSSFSILAHVSFLFPSSNLPMSFPRVASTRAKNGVTAASAMRPSPTANLSAGCQRSTVNRGRRRMLAPVSTPPMTPRGSRHVTEKTSGCHVRRVEAHARCPHVGEEPASASTTMDMIDTTPPRRPRHTSNVDVDRENSAKWPLLQRR
ncbi:hypothetical protein GALMADRAFT_449778 [Galerina marginata CBS 339.88]|uniref:Uncharacterized protein n=1 Tax=Galerina marginata (strain CBS 339.88) TaxID=685588 RepID=A0A067T2K4_GALM3|nr:hypothetical protein GALMADRAFT_449778 [Galerina marginata CBS 339.88]